MARDEATEKSDVDLLVSFNGLSTFDNYMGLKLFLEDLLNCSIDLVTEKAVREEIRPEIERELHYVIS